MIEQNLDSLEEKSIYIMREAKMKFKNLAALWSMGKDSTTMLAIARKAFMGKVPFPVIHIDNSIDFPETYKFREELTKKWDLELIVAKSKIKPEISGFSCCGANKTEALKEVMKEYKFDALIVSIRRDEHAIRAKERYVSPRDRNFKWNYKNQPAELW
ncbi:MAG: phosphoadenosine phosphosulfate reductase family protein, partial [Candidatus Micrarchaeaceae archaeon]